MQKLTLLYLLIATLCFTACGDDSDNPEPQNSDPFITAQIDGADFTADTILAESDDFDGAAEDVVIAIAGTDSNTNLTIGFLFPEREDVIGSTEVDADNAGLIFSDEAGNAFITEGDFTINELDTVANLVTGTFSFTATNEDDATDTYSITEGEFRVNYND